VRPARRQTDSDDAREASPPAAFLAQSVGSCVEGIRRMILHRRLESPIGDQQAPGFEPSDFDLRLRGRHLIFQARHRRIPGIVPVPVEIQRLG
jgi:hypothetical protein